MIADHMLFFFLSFSCWFLLEINYADAFGGSDGSKAKDNSSSGGFQGTALFGGGLVIDASKSSSTVDLT